MIRLASPSVVPEHHKVWSLDDNLSNRPPPSRLTGEPLGRLCSLSVIWKGSHLGGYTSSTPSSLSGRPGRRGSPWLPQANVPPNHLRAHLKEAASPRACGQGMQPTGAFPRESWWAGAPPHVETPQASTAAREPGCLWLMASSVISK